MHSFPKYMEYNPKVDAYFPTHDLKGCFHRFFDTSPFSPSNRYLALTRMPFEDHVNQPGDRADIVVTDLETGEHKIVYSTAGWEMQMGANLQWGESDDILLFDDVDTKNWTSHGVRLNWKTGEFTLFPRGIYHASPDGKKAAVTNPVTMRRTQAGYGVLVPDGFVPVNQGLSEEDGLFITDVNTGKMELVASIKKFVMDGVPKEEQDDYNAMENYGFHCKWNDQGDRLMFTLRRKPENPKAAFGATNHQDELWFDVFTCRPDGSEIHRAVPWTEWKKGGHHTTFFPSGDKLSMNVNLRGKELVLMQVNYDGTEYKPMTQGVPGSGHPVVLNDRYLVADTYAVSGHKFHSGEYPEGYTPLRLIDYKYGTEEHLLWYPTKTPSQDKNSVMRVDPHVALSRDKKMIIVNTFYEGTRKPLIFNNPMC
jgi:hypothetical protein